MAEVALAEKRPEEARRLEGAREMRSQRQLQEIWEEGRNREAKKDRGRQEGQGSQRQP